MKYPAAFEWLKWAAFACMLIDHTDLILFDRAWPVTYQIGRFAYPTFVAVFTFGVWLSADGWAVAARTAAAAFVAQLAWWSFDPGYGANVLWVLAVLALIVVVVKLEAWWDLSALLACLAIAWPVLEGAVYGFPLGLGIVAALHFRSRLPAVVGVLPLLLWPPGLASYAAVAAVAAAPRVKVRALRRAGGVLLWAYPAHLAFLSAVRALRSFL